VTQRRRCISSNVLSSSKWPRAWRCGIRLWWLMTAIMKLSSRRAADASSPLRPGESRYRELEIQSAARSIRCFAFDVSCFAVGGPNPDRLAANSKVVTLDALQELHVSMRHSRFGLLSSKPERSYAVAARQDRAWHSLESLMMRRPRLRRSISAVFIEMTAYSCPIGISDPVIIVAGFGFGPQNIFGLRLTMKIAGRSQLRLTTFFATYAP
jgi:hypothetical protein